MGRHRETLAVIRARSRTRATSGVVFIGSGHTPRANLLFGMIATRAVILPVTDSDHGPLPRHVQPRGAKYLSPALTAPGS